MPAACAEGAVVVLAAEAEIVPKGCRLIDQTVLRETGPLAVIDDADGPRFVMARARARIWSGAAARNGILPSLDPAPLAVPGQ